MADDLIDLLTESRVALGEMICDANVPVEYSPHLMAARTRMAKASDEIERLRDLCDKRADYLSGSYLVQSELNAEIVRLRALSEHEGTKG